jgi:hypothetical protein
MTAAAALDERSRRAIRFVAVGVAVVGLGALLGWAIGSPLLIRLVPSFPPVRPVSALGLVGVAIGLFGVGTNRRPLLLAGGALALLSGGGTLIAYQWNAAFGDSGPFRRTPYDLWASARMSVASALSLTALGLGLLVLWRKRWSRAGSGLAGIMGALVATLGITILFTYSTDVLGGLRASWVSGLAVQSAVAYAASGFCIVLVAWQRDPGLEESPIWVPAAVGIASLVTTLVLWRALLVVARDRGADLLQRYAGAAQHELLSQVEASVRRVRTLGSAARQQSGERRPGRAASDLFASSPAITDFGWLDSTLTVRASGGGRESVLSDRLAVQAVVDRERPALVSAVHDARPMARVLTTGARPAIVVFAPLCSEAPCAVSGYGVLQPDSLLHQAFAIVVPGYDISVYAFQTPIYGAPTPEAATVTMVGKAATTAYGIGWFVEARPSPVMMALFSSDLPDVVFGLGVIVSILFATTTRLAQTRVALARQSERRRLRSALEGTSDGVWERIVSSGEETRSPAVWRRLGYDPATIAPSVSAGRWTSLIHPDQRSQVVQELERLKAGRSSEYETEYKIQANDGEWHWMVERGRVSERTPAGIPERLLGIVADVTERRRADQVIAESERRFRAMFDGGFHLTHLLDLDCRLLEANRTALDFGGVEYEAVRGAFIWDTPWWWGDTARQDRLRNACAEAAKGKTVRYDEEIWGGEERRLIDFSLKPIFDDSGNACQLLAESRDVTELRRAESAVRQMDTLSTMGRLAARIAHEINNPLAGIQNSFLLIKDAVPESHPYHAYVGAIEREIARIAAVTRQLYETYRQEGDGAAMSSASLVISDATRMLAQVYRASQVSISVDASGAPAALPIPDALLRQAVYNLVQNAVEASPPGETVLVRAWQEGDWFWLSVRDHGSGVSCDMRERIFEPFVSTKSGVSTAGMGLGLSLVRKSVVGFGGRIDIYDPEGGGAEFRIGLPLARTQRR